MRLDRAEVGTIRTYNVGEEEPRVGQLEMFEERVELETVEAAPGTVEVLPGLGLLAAVVVVEELVDDPGDFPSSILARTALALHAFLLLLFLPASVCGLQSVIPRHERPRSLNHCSCRLTAPAQAELESGGVTEHLELLARHGRRLCVNDLPAGAFLLRRNFI